MASSDTIMVRVGLDQEADPGGKPDDVYIDASAVKLEGRIPTRSCRATVASMGARRGGYSAEDMPTAAAWLRGVGRMDVRLITKSGVEERGVEELPLLLQGEDNLVWVDIPAWDDEAVRVLSEVFRFHPLAAGDRRGA
jgi:hypothetical protein